MNAILFRNMNKKFFVLIQLSKKKLYHKNISENSPSFNS